MGSTGIFKDDDDELPVDGPGEVKERLEEVDAEDLDADLLAMLGMLPAHYERKREPAVTVKVNVTGGSLLSIEALLK